MLKFITLLSAIAVSTSPLAAQVQQVDPNQLQQAPFASENAIIDTAIPFAIGSREAQQSLRGAFGWPTFQEGLVHGVYFRFDPDGYARFAPTPRLDTDVFEVICRPRTYSCMGRKGPLSLILNSRGQIQLKIDDVLSGDRFYVSEGVSEIEVPERILQPLDTQLELLLSTGGDLVIRRGENEKDRISLTGFMPVSAYLRWVAARQDYTILPRGWPIPNAANPSGGVTQATSWQSPMPQPQNFPNVQGDVIPNNLQTNPQPLQVQQQIQPTAPNSQTDVDEVKSELKVLRELLMARNQDPANSDLPSTAVQTDMNTGSITQLMPQNVTQSPVTDQLAALQDAANRIQADIARLTNPNAPAGLDLSSVQLAPTQHSQLDAQQPLAPAHQDPTIETAKRLQYLMSEIGLDAKTALMLIQLGDENTQTDSAMKTASTLTNTTQETPQPTFKNDLVAQILQELEGNFSETQTPEDAVNSNLAPSISDADFQLLSQYFKSVVIPR